MNLTVERHNNEGVYRVKISDDILQMLEDHLVQLYAMTGSKYALACLNMSWIATLQCENVRFRYISIFIKEVNYLEKSLALIMEVLEMMLSVQRQHVYAEVNRSNVVIVIPWFEKELSWFIFDHLLCFYQKLKCTDATTRNLYDYFFIKPSYVGRQFFNQVALIVYNFCFYLV